MNELTKIKTCIIGNMSVGKTSLILRIHDDQFREKTIPTSGVDYNNKKQTINGETVNVQLWDTTGQDRFRSVVSNFFRGAHGIFLTFDLTNPKSLTELQIWIKQLNSVVDEGVPKVLLGNKSDLKPFLSSEEEELVKKYCSMNRMQFFKVSAKTGEKVNEAYQTLVQQSYTYYYSLKKEKTIPIVIEEDRKKKDRKKCC